jgi:hypothetical protein
MPFFRCKLRQQYQIKVLRSPELDHTALVFLACLIQLWCSWHVMTHSVFQGNIIFDCLACLLCGGLAPLQEFREVSIHSAPIVFGSHCESSCVQSKRMAFMLSKPPQAAIRDKKYSTLTSGGHFGSDEELPKVVSIPQIIRTDARKRRCTHARMHGPTRTPHGCPHMHARSHARIDALAHA